MAGVEAAPSQSITISNGYKISRVIKLKDHAFGYRMSPCGSSKLNDEPQFGVRGPSLEAAVHYMVWS